MDSRFLFRLQPSVLSDTLESSLTRKYCFAKGPQHARVMIAEKTEISSGSGASSRPCLCLATPYRLGYVPSTVGPYPGANSFRVSNIITNVLSSYSRLFVLAPLW
jgi:hypothetical protein